VQSRSKHRPILRRIGLGAALALVCAAGQAAGEPAAEPEVGAVSLDQLLRLPTGSGFGSQLDRRAGFTKSEWETRFREAGAARADAESAIARTRAAIEKKAAEEGGGQWRMAMPGMGNVEEAREPGSAPLDYRLTQTLRRNREELARAERQIQDLVVEANLASVPDEWRGRPTDLEAPH